MVASSIPLYIRINLLHSGGIGLPLSHCVTLNILLKQSATASSLDIPDVNLRKM